MTQTVALPNDGRPSIASFIETLRPEIARALPSGQDAARIARIALTAVRKSENEARKSGNPKVSLARCTVESFAGALLTAAALGLEPGTDEAYLVPYAGECTLIVGYQGISKLFYQHPLAADLSAEYVCANDEFDYQKGTDPYLRHKPATGERGDVVAYYAVARLTNGSTRFEVLTPEQCKRLRQGKVGAAASFKAGDPEHWMERKTVVKQLAKLLPKTPLFQAALQADERAGSELRDVAVAAPAERRSLPAPQLDEDATHASYSTPDDTGGGS